MQKLAVISGILVFLLGAWFDFGAFVSGDPNLRPTWEAFVVPVAINAIGLTMIALGLKHRTKIQPSPEVSR
jgi:hypothetical protein